MKPTTAVIFAAGIGTRMLPITAVIQKELLPIGNRPVIDYIVEDLVIAGITRIIFVVRSGQFGLKDYYLGNAALERNLMHLGKTAALAQLSSIHNQASFEFIEQSETAGYGTAVPLQIALSSLDSRDPVVVCSGDDVVWHANKGSEFESFIDTYTRSGADGAIMALESEDVTATQYGQLRTKVQDGVELLTNIIEKPEAEQSKTQLVNISKYILSGSVRDYVTTVKPRPENSELYITDAIIASLTDQKIVVHRISGEYLDTGTPESWLAANQTIAAAIRAQKST